MRLDVAFQNQNGFITDFGESCGVEVHNAAGLIDFAEIPRYGVWKWSSKGKYEVVHTTDVLQDGIRLLEGEENKTNV